MPRHRLEPGSRSTGAAEDSWSRTMVKDEQVNNLMKATPNGAFTGKIGGGKISVIRRKEVMGIEPGHTGQEAP